MTIPEYRLVSISIAVFSLLVLIAIVLVVSALNDIGAAIRAYPTPSPVVQPVQSFDIPPIIVRVYPEPGR
jgi:hypothetical protein